MLSEEVAKKFFEANVLNFPWAGAAWGWSIMWRRHISV